jgi:hypothetical protein
VIKRLKSRARNGRGIDFVKMTEYDDGGGIALSLNRCWDNIPMHPTHIKPTIVVFLFLCDVTSIRCRQRGLAFLLWSGNPLDGDSLIEHVVGGSRARTDAHFSRATNAFKVAELRVDLDNNISISAILREATRSSVRSFRPLATIFIFMFTITIAIIAVRVQRTPLTQMRSCLLMTAVQITFTGHHSRFFAN